MEKTIRSIKAYCLEKADTYQGTLGKELLIQLMLSTEKKAMELCEKNPELNKKALLVGIYFTI